MSLEQHYSGDKAWMEFVAIHKGQPMSGKAFNPSDFVNLPEVPSQMEGVLEVAVSYFGSDRVKDWLDQKIPALGDMTPRACIFGNSSNELKNRIREYLMRLPT